jgi:hypothetical protein
MSYPWKIISVIMFKLRLQSIFMDLIILERVKRCGRITAQSSRSKVWGGSLAELEMLP